MLTDAITDYLLLSEGKAGFEKATKGRLAHVIEYVAETNPAVTVAQIDARWVDRFRAWLHKRPVVSPTGKVLRQRSLGHVEGCVPHKGPSSEQVERADARRDVPVRA